MPVCVRLTSRSLSFVVFGVTLLLAPVVSADEPSLPHGGLAHEVILHDSATVRPLDVVAARFDEVLEPLTAAQMMRVFERQGYDLDVVRQDLMLVPRIFVASIPEDMAEIDAVAVRKDLFLRALLPAILTVNERIAHERARAQLLFDRMDAQDPLSREDRRWLVTLQQDFGLEGALDRDALLERLDIVPTSLALAQAIQESGWGTSRFATQGNALFGQRTWSANAPGLTPVQRAQGASHRVRAFSHLLEAVRAYILNLNTHEAYLAFRQLRADQRVSASAGGPANGEGLNSLALLPGLMSYSEDGDDYVAVLEVLITQNNLRDFDGLRLAPLGSHAIAALF